MSMSLTVCVCVCVVLVSVLLCVVHQPFRITLLSMKQDIANIVCVYRPWRPGVFPVGGQ
jgi:hypothetical protein